MSEVIARKKRGEQTRRQKFAMKLYRAKWFVEDWWYGYGKFRKVTTYSPKISETEMRDGARDYYHALGDALGAGQTSIELR